MNDPLFKRTVDCREIVAADDCRLRELFHPDRDGGGPPCSLAVAYVEPGEAAEQLWQQASLEEDELYYFLEGRGSIEIEGCRRDVRCGDVVLVPRGATQSVTNEGTGELRWLNVVSPPWRLDHDERV